MWKQLQYFMDVSITWHSLGPELWSANSHHMNISLPSGSRERTLQKYPARSKTACCPFLVFTFLHQSHEINETMTHRFKKSFHFFLSNRQDCKMKHMCRMFKNRFKQIILRNPNGFSPLRYEENTPYPVNKRAEPPSICGSCPLKPWRNTPFWGGPPRHMKHKGVAKNISLRNGGLLITRFSQGRKRNGGCFFLVCRDVRDVDMEEPDKNLQFNNYNK